MINDEEFERAQSGGISGVPDSAETMRAELATLLGLEQIGRTLVAVKVFGRGPNASVDIQLSGDVKITFEQFGDVSRPAALTAHLMSYVGIARTFKGKDAAQVGALIHRLADHHGGNAADDAAREWGSEFLRLASSEVVDLLDQADRWRAFSALERMNPQHDAGEDRSAFSLACASTVLLDRGSGVRYVRCGWFLAYVRREAGGMYNPASLVTQMHRVGWTRRGAEGLVKATRPSDGRALSWAFYIVPKDWE